MAETVLKKTLRDYDTGVKHKGEKNSENEKSKFEKLLKKYDFVPKPFLHIEGLVWGQSGEGLVWSLGSCLWLVFFYSS